MLVNSVPRPTMITVTPAYNNKRQWCGPLQMQDHIGRIRRYENGLEVDVRQPINPYRRYIEYPMVTYNL